ncbi:hypothetical protein [Streptomyces sp. NPDC046685]
MKRHSRRAADNMRHLARLAAVHHTTPEAAKLRDRIKETIKT